jgi:hypothetical protein
LQGAKRAGDVCLVDGRIFIGICCCCLLIGKMVRAKGETGVLG